MNIDTTNNHFQLIYNTQKERLELCNITNKKTHPLFIDFLSEQLSWRKKNLAHASGRELIAKAVGNKKDVILKILDATAGFGVDAFMLASLGHDVTMLERSPIIANLLQDGLRRALDNLSCSGLQLKFLHVDALIYMQNFSAKTKADSAIAYDVVYLDPMYPTRTKTALNKKSLRILKTIVGQDLDAAELFTAALRCAKHRVVVKRPRAAKTITDLKPTFVLTGASCRYDVYQI